MTLPFPRSRAMLVAFAITLSACGSGSTTTTPTIPRTTDTFTGTLGQRATVYHLFTVTQLGQVDVTLTKTEPLATIIIGMGISQTSGGQCIPVLLAYNNNSQAGTVISGTADVGSYCVAVYDLGNVADPITYTVTVTHP